MPEEGRREAHVPAEHPAQSQAPRVPPPDAYQGRPADRPVTPGQGPHPAVGLIGRVRDRATFEALRREGRRVRRGPVTVVFADTAPEAGIRVAYGTPRRIGTAVTRNRVRRRLRSAVRELAAEGTLSRPGAYLVTVAPDAVGLRYGELRAWVGEAVGALAMERS